MEDWKMTPIHAITAVDIGADGVARGEILESESFESGMLMSGGMGPQKMRGVNIVGVGPGTARVILWKPQDIEVVVDSNNWVSLDKVVELGRGKT